jgi:hypothetical protein
MHEGSWEARQWGTRAEHGQIEAGPGLVNLDEVEDALDEVQGHTWPRSGN